jgi:hypothetical protein
MQTAQCAHVEVGDSVLGAVYHIHWKLQLLPVSLQVADALQSTPRCSSHVVQDTETIYYYFYNKNDGKNLNFLNFI